MKKIKKWINDNICERGQHCSCFIDGSWGECCKRHDRRYAMVKKGRMTRLDADKRLFTCVKNKAGIIIAGIMFIGVRVGGHFYINRK